MNAWVTGAGKTKFGPTRKTLAQLAHEAIVGALRDANRTPDELGAIVVANFLGGPNEGQLHLNSVVAGLMPGLLLPGWRVESACASGGVAVHQACLLAEVYGPILVLGVERLSDVGGMSLTRNIGTAGDRQLDQLVGLNFPANYALVAQAHMAEYGTSLRDLECVSLKNHENAQSNPLAHFHHKAVSQADIDAGPDVASPLRLYDCCPVSDGAAAVIIEPDRHDSRSVRVFGSAVCTDAISLVQRATLTSFPAAVHAAQQAYEQSGCSADDIDMAEVHDCFTIAELVALEDLGLAARGQAAGMTRSGDTAITGRLPVNMDGGLKAGGHAIGATGVSQIYELVKQLRGEAGTRQVRGARLGLAHNVGGVGGTAAVHILGSVQ